jgi:hypothetical protein
MKHTANIRRSLTFPFASIGVASVTLASLFALAACSSETGGSSAAAGSGSTTASATSGGSGGEGGSTGSGGQGGQGSSFDPNEGWTDWTDSSDTQNVYVSSSSGDDNNDGLSEAKAVKTIAKGKLILRNGFPDHLLLKRGDVWNEALGTWSKSGKSASEPIVVAYYGDATERPLLKTGDKGAVYAAPNSTVNYVSLIGLHFYAHTRDPDSPDFVGAAGEEGIRWLATTDGLLIEDVYVQFYRATNITVQGMIQNAAIRRSIIADAYSTSSHSQGIYAQEVTNLLIEGNVFDHNGWNEEVSGAQKTQFNHNMYINATCNNLIVKDNISVRAASHGLQARPGGDVMGNLFVDVPIGFSYGLVLGDSPPKPGGVTGEVAGNVILAGTDIEPEALPRGFGIELGNIKKASIHDNFILHDKSAKPYGAAISLNDNGIGLHDLTIENNVIYDWRGNLNISSGADFLNVLIKGNQVQAPDDMTLLVSASGGFPSQIRWENNTWFSANPANKWFSGNGKTYTYDAFAMAAPETGGAAKALTYEAPDRTIAKFHESIGKTADFHVFMAEARKQQRKRYLYEYTPAAPIAFLTAGFKVVP